MGAPPPRPALPRPDPGRRRPRSRRRALPPGAAGPLGPARRRRIALFAAVWWAGALPSAAAAGAEYATLLCECPAPQPGAATSCTLRARWGLPSAAECAAAGAALGTAGAADSGLSPAAEPGPCQQGTQRLNLDGPAYWWRSQGCGGQGNVRVSLYRDAACSDGYAELAVAVGDADGRCVQAAFEETEGENWGPQWTRKDIIIFVLTPFVTAFIGWGTNVIAIKMIFRPYKKTCGFQGVLPKRQHGLAVQIGDMVEKHLISAEELVEKCKEEVGFVDGRLSQEGEEKLYVLIEEHAVSALLDKQKDTPGFNAFISSMGGMQEMRAKLTRALTTTIKKNLEGKQGVLQVFAASFTRYIPFRDLVTHRIRYRMTPADLENMFMSFMKDELGFVENLGGVLGFMVGCLQTGIYMVAGTG
eukprot:TRINITY_DN11479_c0_g1_i1.p1 TRINITY_DN11479_c0_g1~~TRINITY_DN11479_c0_g1_i1.p1  ORF type:complete len:439 (+),score=153.40 TRINITY_DN11479_c0_g1_i1:70-1317(+)